MPVYRQRDFAFLLRDIWTSYLDYETNGIIHDEPEFALVVCQMICYPERYLELSARIDEILRRRYNVDGDDNGD